MPTRVTTSRSIPRAVSESGCPSNPAPTPPPGKPDLSLIMGITGDTPGVAASYPHDQRDLVVRNIGRLTTWHGPDVEDAAVVIQGGYVSWTGADRLLPVGLPEIEEYDAAGAAVLPGFGDSH